MHTLSFEEAVRSAGKSKKHLLLGNGFSVALKPDIFSYSALLSKANFDAGSTVAQVFETLGTRDFEEAVEAIESAEKIAPLYNGAGAEARKQMLDDARHIKERLIELVIGTHPDRPYDITDAQRDSCIAFIKQFDGKIFTLNYDILLYWVLMDAKERKILDFDDGFRSDPSDPDTPYVVWDNGESYGQNVSYIHGALHLFDAKHQLRKYTWKRTDIPLIDQARAAISEGFFPLFVSEGTSEKKMEKITHSGYLHKAYRNLSGNSGVIFLHGCSLSHNDEHVTQAIERHYSSIYVGLHGDVNSESNKRTIARAEAMKGKKKDNSIQFYDSDSAQVWG